MNCSLALEETSSGETNFEQAGLALSAKLLQQFDPAIKFEPWTQLEKLPLRFLARTVH